MPKKIDGGHMNTINRSNCFFHAEGNVCRDKLRLKINLVKGRNLKKPFTIKPGKAHNPADFVGHNSLRDLQTLPLKQNLELKYHYTEKAQTSRPL
jgi:hypothetical protein